MGKNSHNAGIRGVGLFEIAIFILVAGLILMSGVPAYHVYEAHKHLDTTNNNIVAAQQALDTFYLQNTRFPCPAPRNAPLDGANANGNKFGMELATCSGTSTIIGDLGDGSSRTHGRPILGPSPITTISPWNIRIGTLPVRTLGLPDNVAFDGWNHLVAYAITENYAVSATAPMDLLHGAIYVTDSNLDAVNHYATAYPGIAVYVIAGANADGSGAYGMNGKMQSPCPTSGAASYNCSLASGSQNTPFVSTILQPSQGNRLVLNPFALRAGTCISMPGGGGPLGNVSFFVDDSGSMATPDISTVANKSCSGHTNAAPGCETRMLAAQTALDNVIPTLISAKAQSDPTNLVGIANFGTYWSRDGQDGGANDSGETACGGLTGLPASDCLFGAPGPNNPAPNAIGAFPITDVSSVINNPTTANISTIDYNNAKTTLVNNVNAMVANGGTPLYDSMIDLAEGVEGGTPGGTPKKPDALIIVSDGANNEGNSTNNQMINTIVSKYPNLQVDFVFVGDQVDSTAVQAAVFAVTPQGNQLKGKFVQVQNAASILSSLSSLVTICPQP